MKVRGASSGGKIVFLEREEIEIIDSALEGLETEEDYLLDYIYDMYPTEYNKYNKAMTEKILDKVKKLREEFKGI